MWPFNKTKKVPIPAFTDLEVIQLGVGGAPTSGKTVLIDSLFRMMGAFRPSYLDKTNLVNDTKISLTEISSVYPDNPYNGYYHDIKYLNSYVTQNFHRAGMVTTDNGEWNENTYKALLTENGRPAKIILVRNISGEMFNVYFSIRIVGRTLGRTLHQHFEEFLGARQNEYKDLSFSAITSITSSPNTLFEGYFAYLTQKEPAITETEKLPIKRFFYAYNFFRTSTFFIYCLDLPVGMGSRSEAIQEGLQENIYNANRAIQTVGKVTNSFYVITKIDQYFTEAKVLNNTSLISAGSTDYELYDISELNTKENYWQTMRYVYNSIYDFLENKENYNSKLFSTEALEIIRFVLDNNFIPETAGNMQSGAIIKDNIFFSSATYHKTINRFIPVEADYKPLHITDTARWHEGINNSRTPVGVLEIWLRLLHENSFNLNKLDILPNGKEDNDIIIKKIRGINSRNA